MQSHIDHEHLVETLAAADETYSPSDEFTDSSVLKVKADLDLLQKHLQQPPPADPFGEESACEQALNLVAAIGRDPSFVTRQQLAVELVAAADEETALPGGGMLGQYRLLTKLGEGGFGTVYKAVHTRLDKVVALKLLTAGRLQNPDAVTRFNREMRAVGKLHHANIVAAHDAGEIDGTHYLVMELVDGIDLRELVKQRGRLPIGAACEMIRQAALGLQHAHEHGLVHRDIKPSNLMLTLPENHDEAPAVKVLDLGLALLDEDHLENFGELTATGQVMGTLEYMAPEQGADTHAVDIRADIYSLGASLYKLLTGKAPFSSDQYRSPIKLLMALATQDPPPLTTRCPEITPELEAIVMQMLAKKPHERFATPRELADALAPFSQPADVRALVSFLATTPPGEPVDVNAAEFIGTHAINSPQPRPPVTAAPTTTTKVAASPSRTRSNVRGWTALALTACGLLIAAATYVIRIETDKGELVIHSDHPGISVKVKSNGEEVGNGWTMLKGTDNKQLLRTGQIEIELPAELTGEYTVTPNVVTLTKNKQEVVKIERKAVAPTTAAAERSVPVLTRVPHSPPDTATRSEPSPIDRDRAAAKLLISRGGTGNAILKLTKDHIQIRPAIALPDPPFELYDFSLPPGELNNDDVRCLSGLKRVTTITLNEAIGLDAQGLKILATNPRLQELFIEKTSLKTSALSSLSELTLLRQLSISSKQVDDDWQFIKQLPYLRELRISDYEPNAADFRRWGEFPQLRCIEFRSDKTLDAAMTLPLHEKNPLCQVRVGISSPKSDSYYSTVLGMNPVRSGALALLKQEIRLSYFGWESPDFEVTKESVADGKNTSLISIRNVRVPPQFKSTDFAAFGKFPFVALEANDLQQADQFAAKLPLSTVVQEIKLIKSDLTDEGLRQLERLDPVVKLYVQGTKVTKAGIEAFLERRPACIVHSDYGVFDGTFSEQPSPESSRNVVAIDRDRAAAQIWIDHIGSVTVVLKSSGKTLQILRGERLPVASFEFRAARSTADMVSGILEPFAGLSGLQSIEIQGSKVDARAIEYLSRIPNLRKVEFEDTQIWTSEFGKLRELPFLHEIVISAKQVDDNWKFLGDLPHLRTLILNGYRQATLSDFQRWSEFPQLRTIQIEAQVDDAMIATLYEKNPLCRLIALSNDPPKTWKMEVKGFDPVRNGARLLLSQGFRLSRDAYRDTPRELTLAYVRDQRSRDPFTVTTVFVPPQAPPTEQSLSGLSKLSLIRLNATGLQQADTLSKHLPISLSVEEINLSNSDLTDDGLQQLERVTSFPILNVQGTHVTRQGIENFKKARPACQLISNFTPSTVVSPEEIIPPTLPVPPVPVNREHAAAELWQQRLGSGAINFDIQGASTVFTPFTKLPDEPFYLTAATGENVKSLTISDLEHFVSLANLRALNPWGEEIDAKAIPYLKQIRTLTHLDLTNSRIPSSAVADLHEIPHLNDLAIAGEMVDDQWKFLDQMKASYQLRLSRCQPTLADWQRLQDVAHLRLIQFQDEIDVDAAAIAEFQRRNPLCRVMLSRPELRVAGVDPVREAVRQLAGRDIGFDVVQPGTFRHITQKVLNDPTPFDTQILVFNLPKEDLALTPDTLRPLRATPFNELMIRSRGASVDKFLAAMPDGLRGARINICDCNLTDQGLLSLSRISRPNTLILFNTKVTRAGIDAFRKALPDCQLVGNF